MKLKKIIPFLPELYLLVATIYYWFLTANLFNPIAIVLLLALSCQIVFQNELSGIFISSIFIVLNLYLVLALLSELSEFLELNLAFIKMLLIGSLFISFNLIAGGFMMKKYAKEI